MRDPNFAREVAQARDERVDWLDFQIWLTVEQMPPGPIHQMGRAIGPLKRQIARLCYGPSKPLIEGPRARPIGPMPPSRVPCG